MSPINVTFAIPEAQLPELKRYMAQGMIQVEAQPPSDAHASEGHITFVDNAVDQTTGTIKIKGSFANADHSLWPGQYVNVIVTLTVDRNAIVVPAAAVQAGPDGDYVYVIAADQRAELRPVRETGRDGCDGRSLAARGRQPRDHQARHDKDERDKDERDKDGRDKDGRHKG